MDILNKEKLADCSVATYQLCDVFIATEELRDFVGGVGMEIVVVSSFNSECANKI